VRRAADLEEKRAAPGPAAVVLGDRELPGPHCGRSLRAGSSAAMGRTAQLVRDGT